MAPASRKGQSPTVKPADGFNLKVQRVGPQAIVVTPAVKAHNWFAGAFTNLPTDRPVTLRVAMKGHDTRGNRANVAKWQGLWPVMTYADPANYESYIWFQKNKSGQWVSGDPFASDEERLAGNGAVPEQFVMPAKLARQCLSPDGKYWSPWRAIETAEADVRHNVFNIRHRFEAASATVAMRVPYTYTFLQKFLDRLEEAKLPGVAIDVAGRTAAGRKLQIIRLDDARSTRPRRERKTILVIAREHATEHASSWALHGLLTRLIENSPAARRLRADTTWLLIPIEDPDGSADSHFDRLTEQFRQSHGPLTAIAPEVFAYTRYFRDYADRGRTLDLAVSLHNVEAREAPNVSSPFAHHVHRREIVSFNHELFNRLRTAGYAGGTPQPATNGGSPYRLYGWCALHFGTLDIAYEVNDRYPAQRLTLARLQGIGGVLAQQLAAWGKSEPGQRRHRLARATLQRRQRERTAYLATAARASGGQASTHRNVFDLIVLGY